MFGIWERKKPVVHRHWYVPLLDFNTSAVEFYETIEKDLLERQLTGLEISRVEYAEGGMLSAKRVYLRLRRERLLFDVCASPFGTSWFFSCRFSEIPFTLRIWEVLAMLLAVCSMLALYVVLFGWFLGGLLFAASVVGFFILVGTAARLSILDFGMALMPIPVMGAFYETFFRTETYFREDTRIAYVDIVDQIIRKKIEEVTKAKGVKLLEFKDATPPSAPAILSMTGNLLKLGLR